jgi:hypothetical protein
MDYIFRICPVSQNRRGDSQEMIFFGRNEICQLVPSQLQGKAWIFAHGGRWKIDRVGFNLGKHLSLLALVPFTLRNEAAPRWVRDRDAVRR